MQEIPGLPPQIRDLLIWNQVILPLIALTVCVILGLPIVRAIVRRIDRRRSRGDEQDVIALRSEVLDLRQRLETVEDAGQRVAELEERLDFAERMLAQQRQARPLGSGG